MCMQIFLSRKPIRTQPSAEEQVTIIGMFIEGDQLAR